MEKKDLIIIPTYNEAINVQLIYKKIRSTNLNSEILFIDDNSPDNTSEIINKLIDKDAKIHLLKREKKLGIGSAHKEGFVWAKEKQFDYVTTIDADLSHNPDLIPMMLKNIEKYNIIITGRFLKDSTVMGAKNRTATYVLRKKNGGFKISALIPHTPVSE